MITHDTINKFRERVNLNNFVLIKYKCYEGKNQWSRICSAMDWITVAVSYLKENPRPYLARNDDLSSINVYTYISCIDMVFEAVKHLHRILVDPSGTPFYGDKGIFRDNAYCRDDNAYFKLIRSCFGAHPVDLRDYFQSEEKEQRFASWSGGHFSGRDYGVILYSSQPDVNDVFFDISFKELEIFLERTYGYLEVLCQRIADDEEAYVQKLRNTQIQLDSDVCAQLEILRVENQRRYNNEYYRNAIDELALVWKTPITAPKNTLLAEQFRESLNPAIAELFDCLQNMTFSEIATYEEVMHPLCAIPHSASNGLVDISDYVFSNSDRPMIWLPCLIEFISTHVEVTGQESIEELYVLSKIGIYRAYLAKNNL